MNFLCRPHESSAFYRVKNIESLSPIISIFLEINLYLLVSDLEENKITILYYAFSNYDGDVDDELAFLSLLLCISISFERDQLNNILNITIKVNTKASSNVGSRIDLSKSAAIKKSAAINNPLNILVTISRKFRFRRLSCNFEIIVLKKINRVIIIIPDIIIATITSIMRTIYSTAI